MDGNRNLIYKFIVDGAWKYDPDQPFFEDSFHNMNNFVPGDNADNVEDEDVPDTLPGDIVGLAPPVPDRSVSDTGPRTHTTGYALGAGAGRGASAGGGTAAVATAAVASRPGGSGSAPGSADGAASMPPVPADATAAAAAAGLAPASPGRTMRGLTLANEKRGARNESGEVLSSLERTGRSQSFLERSFSVPNNLFQMANDKARTSFHDSLSGAPDAESDDAGGAATSDRAEARAGTPPRPRRRPDADTARGDADDRLALPGSPAARPGMSIRSSVSSSSVASEADIGPAATPIERDSIELVVGDGDDAGDGPQPVSTPPTTTADVSTGSDAGDTFAAGAGAGAGDGASGTSIEERGRTSSFGKMAADAKKTSTFYSTVAAANMSKDGKIIIVMVGLPARGKTYIAQKLRRHLVWFGFACEIFNVGQFRRNILGANQSADFFDHSNEAGLKARQQMADMAMSAMLKALAGDTQVAIFDATNTNKARRKWILDSCAPLGYRVVFLETLCTDDEVIRSNIRETKLKSPDYIGKSESEAVTDFLARIANYAKVYVSLDQDGDEDDMSYIKLVDVGRRIIANRLQGHMSGRLLHFLSNLHITPRPIWLTRHGESLANKAKLIGGDPGLSELGKRYAKKLARYMDNLYPPQKQLGVWISTLKRTGETVQHLLDHRDVVEWKALDEIDAGICDSMTYEQIKARWPEDYEARQRDKFHFRYPRGESYQDIVHRLEPLIIELMRHEAPILIVSHQATLRVLYAYLMNSTPQECPRLSIPLHTLIQITPKAYGAEEVRHKVL